MCSREATSPQVRVKESTNPQRISETVCKVSQGTLYKPRRKGADAHAGGSSEMQDHSMIKRQALEPDRWDPYISHYYY